MGKEVEGERMFLIMLNRKIWLSSPCDGLLLTLTIQQANSELKDSWSEQNQRWLHLLQTSPTSNFLVLEVWSCLNPSALLQSLAGGLSLSSRWPSLWKVTHLCHATGGNRLCSPFSFSEFYRFFQTVFRPEQHQVLFQVSGSVTFIQDAVTVPWFTSAVSVRFGSSPGAGNMSSWDS